MTVASETNRSGPYNGNGVTTAFDYEFRILDEAHLRCVTVDEDGVEVDLVLTTDYTVTGVNDAGGGQVILNSALASGLTLTIVREIPFTQETDLENQGAYNAEDIEDALDAAAMRDQQMQEQLDRSVKISIGQDPSSLDAFVDAINNLSGRILLPSATLPAVRDDGSSLHEGDIFYNTTDNVLMTWTGSTWADIAEQSINMTPNSFVGDGAETDFTMSRAPALAANVLVWVGGVRQVPTTDYTVAGVTLTLISAPGVGVAVETLVMAATSVLNIPADGSVEAISISDDPDEQLAIRLKLGIADIGFTNVGFATSVAAGALTISLKGLDGNDPAPENPVRFAIRNVDLTVGLPDVLTITSPLSLVISSGSTLGFTSAIAGRLWLVVFNDGGTARLGVINCRSGTNIYPLDGNAYASSTAEGGAGAADSAHTFYTGTAVANKAYAIIGYMEWGTGLAAAGTWSVNPTAKRLYTTGSKLPGDVVQVVSSTTTTNTTVTDATFVGTASAVTLTPTAAPNVVAVTAVGPIGIVSIAADKRCRARIARGGAQIGTGCFIAASAAGQHIFPGSMAVMDAPGTVSACTWTVQINTDASQTGLWGHPGDGAGGAFMCAAELMA